MPVNDHEHQIPKVQEIRIMRVHGEWRYEVKMVNGDRFVGRPAGQPGYKQPWDAFDAAVQFVGAVMDD